jgi:hypothetical protein
MGLQQAVEGDRAGGGPEPVDGERGRGDRERPHGGQHQVDQAAQDVRAEDVERAPRVGDEPQQQRRAEGRADADGADEDSVGVGWGAKVLGGEHDEQGAGCAGRQGSQQLPDR